MTGRSCLSVAPRALPWTRKPLKRLDLNFYIMTVPTLCGKLALALRSCEQMGSVCTRFAKKQTRTFYPARSLRLFFTAERIAKQERPSRIRPRGLRAALRSREQVGSVCTQFLYVRAWSKPSSVELQRREYAFASR